MSGKFYTSTGRAGEGGTSINRWITFDIISAKKLGSTLLGLVRLELSLHYGSLDIFRVVYTDMDQS